MTVRANVLEKFAKERNNGTADKNIKLHHATAELKQGEEDEEVSAKRYTTFWRES